MFLQRQSLQTLRIVLPGVRVQRLIAKKIESPSTKLVRAAARAQIDAPAGCSSVLSRKLVANDLNFVDRFERWREAFARGTVVVVVQSVNRDVV